MPKDYEKLVRETIKASPLYSMSEDQLVEIFLVSKALLFNGHFKLLSGLHTDTFLRFALIAQHPWLMSRISKEMSAWIEKVNLGDIDVVLGTSRAGKWFAYDLARELNGRMKCRAVYATTDKSGYPKELLDGFVIKKKERVLIVNDLNTTGNGLKQLSNIAESYNANIAGMCVFSSRAPSQTMAGLIPKLIKKYKFHSIVDLNMTHWNKNVCLFCKKNMPYVNSIDLNSLTNRTTIKKILEPLKDLKAA